MFNINIDDGYKEFTINNDPNRVIRFNPADIAIIERFDTAGRVMKEAAEAVSDIPLQPDGSTSIQDAAYAVAKVNQTIREQIDYIFNYPVSDAVFGNQSPLASVGGIPLFEQFLTAAIAYVKTEIRSEQRASAARIEKYTNGVVG
ncbi:MAG: hypothetical protein J6B85_06010 [Lachnospiraceae bacterium]|nr:hypothetical protein [Lachnospiraceae bacterium]